MSIHSRLLAALSLLLHRGYTRDTWESLGLSEEHRSQLVALGRSALAAPFDPNNVTLTRRRRFDKAMIFHTGEIQFFPRAADAALESVQVYHQSAGYNPAEAGKLRPFAAFTEAQRSLSALLELLRRDADIVRVVLQAPYAVLEAHLHLLGYFPRADEPSTSSPPFVHCDGESVTMTRLLSRQNVGGGFNAVTTLKGRNLKFSDIPKKEVLDVFTLENFLEGFTVVDTKVAHYVSPIEAVGPDAHRIVLLTDYTVLRMDIEE